MTFDALESRQVLTSATNAAFVAGLYTHELSRTGLAPEIDAWVQQMNLGLSKSDVVNSFDHSLERQNNEVNDLYNKVLKRQADPDGLNSFSTLLKQGRSTAQIEEIMYASPEYQATHTDASSFVTGLYHDSLGRSPDAGGLDSWKASLAAGTSRDQVSAAFMGSTERVRNDVEHAYQTVLGRAADSPGSQSFVDQIETGKINADDLDKLLLDSTEFSNEHGGS